MITIVDYGMGNVGSLINIFNKVGVDSHATSCPDELRKASKIVLPGVGAFDAGMRNLKTSGLMKALEERVRRDSIPLLGVCLGMQLLGRRSEEGTLEGLGWISAESKRFVTSPDIPIKVPHMGWAYTLATRPTQLLSGMPPNSRFYFVHSYHVVCDDPSDVIAEAEHGSKFCAAVNRGNIWGVQFHPEKSHSFGMQLCRNFAAV
jgi:glutamine amidotransferase